MTRQFDNSSLVETNCPLCKGLPSGIIIEKFGQFCVLNCQDCRLFFLSPRLRESAAISLYKDNQYFEGKEGGYTGYQDQQDSLKATFQRFIKNLAKQGITGGNLLEVGCGYGYLLESAEWAFSDRYGTDFSEKAVSEASQKADHVYRGGIDQLPQAQSFNCIIANHVIEHVYNPVEFVKKLADRLEPGGHIVLSTPDMGSFWRRMMGRKWPSYKIPEHITFFDNGTLRLLMKKAGLVDIGRVAYPHAFPVSLMLDKLGICYPGFKPQFYLWMPATTVACYGKKQKNGK